MARSRPRAVQSTDTRAHSADGAAEQTDNLDLVGELIECDAATAFRVEFVGTMWPEQKIVVVEAEDHAEPTKLAALEDPPHFPDIRIKGMGVADDELHSRLSAAATTASHSSSVRANGFSTSTCLPCSIASMACCA